MASLKIRRNLLIQRIIKNRNDSAKLIQKNFKRHFYLNNLLFLAAKHKEFYSVYPSKKIFTDIAIKLFTDLRNPVKFKILPVKFCPIRNAHVFDISKSKFLKNKKIMRFNFVIDGKITIDSTYDYVVFGDSYVNQIDFKVIDNKIIKNFKKFDLSLEKKTSDSDSDEESSSEEPSQPIRKKRSVGTNLKLKKPKRVNSTNKCLLDNRMDLSESERSVKRHGSRNNSKKIKRTNSILKFRGASSDKKLDILSKSTDSVFKKVSFGVVQYSY